MLLWAVFTIQAIPISHVCLVLTCLRTNKLSDYSLPPNKSNLLHASTEVIKSVMPCPLFLQVLVGIILHFDEFHLTSESQSRLHKIVTNQSLS